MITGESGNKMPIFYSLGNFVSSQRDNFNMLGGMAKVVITKDQTGTYVSDYNIEPLVNVIQSGGTHGHGAIASMSTTWKIILRSFRTATSGITAPRRHWRAFGTKFLPTPQQAWMMRPIPCPPVRR